MSRTSAPALALALALAIAASASSVAAQDPAAVGGSGGDPALVGGRGGWVGPSAAAPANAPSFPLPGAAAERNDPQRAVREVEALLGLVRGQLDGSRRGDAPGAERSDAIRYRGDAETLIRRHWDRLGPLTRDLYTAQYGSSDPNDPNQRYRSPYGDGGQIEKELLGGVQDAQQAMQSLEDLLLPMLQDLKRGVDTELRNRANTR